MTKQCMIALKKNCDNCDACNVCDIDAAKICDSCGKCLETEVNDYKQVVVDEVDDLNEEVFELKNEISSEHSIEYDYFDKSEEQGFEEDPNVDFIDDIDGLNELLDDPEKGSFEEVFPGFYILKNNKKGLH